MHNHPTEDEPHPVPDPPPEGELQDPPVPPVVCEEPAADNPLLPMTIVPPLDNPTPVAIIHSPDTASPNLFALNWPSTFITLDTLKYWERVAVHGGENWINMVKAYLQFKQMPAPVNVSKLLPQSSP